MYVRDRPHEKAGIGERYTIRKHWCESLMYSFLYLIRVTLGLSAAL